jgi:hypothetical protein
MRVKAGINYEAEFDELGQLRTGPLFPVMIEFPVLGGTDSEGRLILRCSTFWNKIYSRTCMVHINNFHRWKEFGHTGRQAPRSGFQPSHFLPKFKKISYLNFESSMVKTELLSSLLHFSDRKSN